MKQGLTSSAGFEMQPGTAVKPDARAIVIVQLRFYMSYKRDQLAASGVRASWLAASRTILTEKIRASDLFIGTQLEIGVTMEDPTNVPPHTDACVITQSRYLQGHSLYFHSQLMKRIAAYCKCSRMFNLGYVTWYLFLRLALHTGAEAPGHAGLTHFIARKVGAPLHIYKRVSHLCR